MYLVLMIISLKKLYFFNDYNNLLAYSYILIK